jgi:nitrogen fixation/metabolism regulation signal transduction histidine kinase
MKNQKGIINITLVVVIVVIAVLMAGAAWWYESNKEEVVSNSNAVTNTTAQSIFNEIQSRIAAGTSITINTDKKVSNLPLGIITGQAGDTFILDDILFAQIIQRNTNFSVLPNDTELNWAGLLVSTDSGESWQKYYSVFSGNVKHNVVGLFTENKTLFIDVADANGAGSGEGNLTRLSSTNGGQTWSKENCYYLIPESYYTPSVADRTGIDLDGLEINTACTLSTS